MKHFLLILFFAAGVAAQPSALFPSSVPGWNDLLCASNSASTTLSGSITDSATSITVADGSGWAACSTGFVFRIENEIIRCSARSTNTFSTCTRGFNGTTAAAHSTSEAVRGVVAAEHHNRLAAEVRAIMIGLGASFPATGLQAASSGTLVGRTLGCASSTFCSVTNGTGASGNPSIVIGSDVALKSDSSGIPSGMVAFFAVSSCPSGWAEYTAMRGRYAVGLVSSGALEGTAGTALTNQESRAVGQHTHSVTDPGHLHTYSQMVAGGSTYVGAGSTFDLISGNTSTATTGITIANSGSVAGTNAPYIQLLGCKKN